MPCDLNNRWQVGETPALWAANNGHLNCLSFLMDVGVDMTETNIVGTVVLWLFPPHPPYGDTPHVSPVHHYRVVTHQLTWLRAL
jgi:hypothetical protein